MKFNVFNAPVLLALFAGLVLPTPTAHAAANSPIIHSVTGSGLTIDPLYGLTPNFRFHTGISAWQRADGSVGGKCVVHVMDLFPDITEPSLIVGEITCLQFEGNAVYFTMRVLRASDGMASVGDAAVGYIIDHGDDGADETYSGPAFYFTLPGMSGCEDHDTWMIPHPAPIASGNFVVR